MENLNINEYLNKSDGDTLPAGDWNDCWTAAQDKVNELVAAQNSEMDPEQFNKAVFGALAIGDSKPDEDGEYQSDNMKIDARSLEFDRIGNSGEENITTVSPSYVHITEKENGVVKNRVQIQPDHISVESNNGVQSSVFSTNIRTKEVDCDTLNVADIYASGKRGLTITISLDNEGKDLVFKNGILVDVLEHAQSDVVAPGSDTGSETDEPIEDGPAIEN